MKFYKFKLLFILVMSAAKAFGISLLMPENNADFQNSRGAILQWRADGENIASYQVHLGLAPDALALIGDAGTNTYFITGPLDKDCDYFWQITGTNESAEVFTSEVRRFTVRDPLLRCYNFVPSADPDNFDTEADAAIVETIRPLELDKTVLLVIDFWDGAHEIVGGPNIVQLVRLARRHSIPVIHLPHDYPMSDAITPMPWEPVWDYSPLDEYLAENGFSTLLYSGLATAECVTMSRVNSIYPLGQRGDYDMILFKDCTFSRAWHYPWAVNGVETICASSMLDNLCSAVAEPACAQPVNIQLEDWPPMPAFDTGFGIGLRPEQTALVVVNAWADHANEGWRERMLANNTNNIKQMLEFARFVGMPVAHVANGRPIDSSCAPQADECLADSYSTLNDFLESRGVTTLVYTGNFMNNVNMFFAAYPWRLTLHNGGYRVSRYATYLLEDCIICYESPESLASKNFKTVFLERATCYQPEMHKVSQLRVLQDNMLQPIPELTATEGTVANAVMLTWTPILGAVKYKIIRSETTDVSGAVLVAETSDAVFTDLSVPHGRQCYYWVVAETFFGETAPCEAVEGYAGLAAPGGLIASDGAYVNKIGLAWDPVPGAEEYEVYRGFDGNFNNGEKVGTAAFTIFDDFDVQAGIQYVYWVIARNALACSSVSAPDIGWRRSAGAAGTRFFDFHANGKAEFALYYEPLGLWFVATPDGGFSTVYWGGPGMTPVPGDYDGDGCADFAVYHEQSGLWFVLNAQGHVLAWAESFGGLGFLPVPGDYDGDFCADLAVYDMVGGLWYVRALAEPRVIWWGVWLGGFGMTPVPGDYDGNGVSDFCVYEPTGGRWYVLSDAGQVLVWAAGWGGAGFVPVWGDYDGDGRSDMAVYDLGAGVWYVLGVDGRVLLWAESWGGLGMEPVPGDYDGDGASDLAVYYQPAGLWYIKSAVTGSVIYFAEPFGGAGFVPLW